MDISAMLVGKSDQLDNVDLISGPRDFTITGVSGGSSEQPLNVALAEYDRPWRPGLTMRRLMAAMWNTTDASLYIGRRVRLYRDADVSFGKDKTGGTRISAASHLDKTARISLPTSKGKFGLFIVEPLADVKPSAKLANNSTAPNADDVAASTDIEALKVMWRESGPEIQAQIVARVAELTGGAK